MTYGLLTDMPNVARVVFIAMAVLWAHDGVAQTQFITPTDVTGVSWYGAQNHPTNLINSSGLSTNSPEGTHDNDSVAINQWLAGTGVPGAGIAVVSNQVLVFNLGQSYDLTKTYVWQQNQGNPDSGGLWKLRAVSNMIVSVSGESNPSTATFKNLGERTLAVAGGTDEEPAQVRDVFARSVRLVKFHLQTVHSGSTSEYVGLSEVRFVGVEAGVDWVYWYEQGVSAVTSNSADANATLGTNVTASTLVWDTSDKGTGSITNWAFSRSLGPLGAGPVSATMTNLIADAAYSWRYYGVSATTSGWSGVSQFLSALSGPQAPVFTDASPGLLSVALGWQDNASNETAYLLQRSTNAVDFVGIASLPADATAYVDTGLLSGTYYYRVAATNAANGSATDFAATATNALVDNGRLFRFPSYLVSTGETFDVSVTLGRAKFKGNGLSGSFGEGTILDYRFFDGVHTNANGLHDGYAYSGAGLIESASMMSSQSVGAAFADLWTINDPDPDFSSVPDFAAETLTAARAAVVTGRVDISDLGSGTLYAIYGVGVGSTNDQTFSFSVTMRGPGQTNVVATRYYDGSTINVGWIDAYEISDAADYDAIEYRYEQGIGFADGGAAGRFMGLILDGAAAPAAIHWSAPITSNITETTAHAEAAVDVDLVGATLVWDVANRGNADTSLWANVVSLGAFSAGTVSATMTDLMADRSYVWRFVGVDGDTNVVWSLPAPFSAALSAAQTPVFTGARHYLSSVELAWDDNAMHETSYTLQRSSNGVDYAYLATVQRDSRAYTDHAVAPGSYFYQLRAENGSNGSFTDFANSTTNASVFGQVVATAGATFKLSTFPLKAAFDGQAPLPGGELGDGTIWDYRFFNGANPNGATGLYNGYATGGGRYVLPVAMTNIAGSVDFAELWTTNDPGTNFVGGDPASSIQSNAVAAANVSGTVNIAWLESGSVYFIYGTGSETVNFNFDVSMTGPGEPDVVRQRRYTGSAGDAAWIDRVDFEDATKYNAITFSYVHDDQVTTPGSSARFMGVIVDGVKTRDGVYLIVR